MIRVYAFLLLASLAWPTLAAEPSPVLLGPPDNKLPEGAKFRVGRATDHATYILAFSPDGKTFAAISNAGYVGGVAAPVELWNAETGKHIVTLRYHHTGVMAVAFSPNGELIATSGIDNRLRLWDAKTGKDITKEEINLTGHGYNLNFSSDSKRLLVGSTKLEMYDVATQKPLKAKEGYFAETATNQFFHGAVWSPKGKYVAAAADGGGLRIWNAETGKLLHAVTGNFTPGRTRFVFSADDALLLFSTWPKDVFSVFDLESGKVTNTIPVPAGETSPEFVQFAREKGRVSWISQKQMHETGSRVVVVADATGAVIKRIELPVGVASHSFSNDGKRIAIGGSDGSLRVYEADSGKLEHTLLGAWSQQFRTVYAQAGKVLRTIHFNGIVHDFDAETGNHLKERKLPLKPEETVHFITVSNDGSLLATATDAGVCTLWNLQTGEAKAKPKGTLYYYREPGAGGPGRPFELPPPPLPPGGANPAPNDSECAPPPPPIAPLAPRQPPPPPPFELQPGPPQFYAAFSHDSKLFLAVTGKDEDNITIWDTATGEEKQTLKGPKGATAVALSIDGAHLFVGYGRTVDGEAPVDGEKAKVAVRRFDLKTGKEVQSWKSEPGEKKQNLQFARGEVSALHVLDKETLLIVEAQTYNNPLPPPGAPGRPRPFPNPGQKFSQVRVINLPGREKDKMLDSKGDSQLAISPDGKAVAYLADDFKDPNKPSTALKVVTIATGEATTLTVASGHHANYGDKRRAVTFRPGTKDIAVRGGDGTVTVYTTK
jgi:WD40 repeat protein